MNSAERAHVSAIATADPVGTDLAKMAAMILCRDCADQFTAAVNVLPRWVTENDLPRVLQVLAECYVRSDVHAKHAVREAPQEAVEQTTTLAPKIPLEPEDVVLTPTTANATANATTAESVKRRPGRLRRDRAPVGRSPGRHVTYRLQDHKLDKARGVVPIGEIRDFPTREEAVANANGLEIPAITEVKYDVDARGHIKSGSEKSRIAWACVKYYAAVKDARR